jgi:hypothetical protein
MTQPNTKIAVKKYAAQVRRWMGKGNAVIQRNSWDDEINARLDIEWQGSLEEERYGSIWTDELKVPEDVFLDF